MADVEAENVTWLWPGYIARGKITCLDGHPGTKKSTFSLELAACLSTGRAMPGGGEGIGPVSVILMTAEDGLGDTIRPRLEAAGADLSLIHHIQAAISPDGTESSITLDENRDAVYQAVKDYKAALLIIDPMMAFLGSKINSWKDQDIRRALAPLTTLAEELDCAVLPIRHFKKGTGDIAIHRGGGSVGIVGVARGQLVFSEDPDNRKNGMILAHSKSNLGPLQPSRRFHLEEVHTTSIGEVEYPPCRIRWDGISSLNAEQLLAKIDEMDRNDGKDDDADTGSVLQEAESFLRTMLLDGPKLSKEVQKEAKEAMISDASLKRAKPVLGIVAKRFVSCGPWWLVLPEEPTLGTDGMRTNSERGEAPPATGDREAK
jgi:RecA-family ATPase